MNSGSSSIKELILKVLKDNHITSLNELMKKLEVVGIYIDRFSVDGGS